LLALEAGHAAQGNVMVDRVLAANPKYPEALYVRGLINLMGLRRSKAAARDFQRLPCRRALRFTPDRRCDATRACSQSGPPMTGLSCLSITACHVPLDVLESFLPT
jgi:hypothetical protein